MSRTVDKTKKSNIKCEHCRYACNYRYVCRDGIFDTWCRLKDKPKHYWSRCKDFEWSGEFDYKEGEE